MEGLIYLSKIMIDYSLKTKEKTENKQVIGIKQKKNIIFKDNDYNTNLLIEKDKVCMKRENKDTILELNFGKKSNGKLMLKEYNQFMDLDIKLINLLIDDNIIKIEYEVNEDIIEFSLKYEVI